RKLITQGSDKTVRVWETHSGKELRRLDIKTKWADSICISPNGKLAAVWAQESQRTLRLWNLEAGKEVRQWTFPDVVGSAAFSPDNKILAVGYGSFQGSGGRIVLWELESGKEIRASPRGDTGTVTALAFAADGKTLASAGFGWSMRFWDVGSMKELRATPLLPPLHTVHQLAFSTDGKMLFSRGGENQVRLWDVASGKERIPAAGPSESIHGLAYSPNAKLVAAASANKIWLWSATTGKLVRALVGPGLSSVSDAAFSADGKLLLALLRDNSNEWDGTIQLWDVETGKERRRIQTIQTMGDRIRAIALAPDGRTVAGWGPLTPGVVHIWRLDAATKPRAFVVPSADPLLGFVGSPRLDILRFSPDDKVLYAVSGLHFSILRWNLATGKALPPIGQGGGTPDKIALSPDGRSLAALRSGALYLYEIASNQTRLVKKTPGYAGSVAYSPDGSLLALAYSGDPYCRENAVEAIEKEQVRVVRVADGKVIHRFAGHRGGINCVRFSPDGRTLASGGQDTTVLLWDVTLVRKDAVKEAPPLKPAKLAELWKGLRGTAAEAHGCMWTLISVPSQSVPFLRERLKPVAAADAERFPRLLKKLESDRFAEREEATRELKKLGDSAETALRKAIEGKPLLETRRRVQALLDDLDGSERLRALRAIEVLERLGDKPARDLLRRFSQGAAGAWLTEEARTTLRRLERRPK
ncbi:MAG: WD40 repeat domain-containing protein, partial [Gemmataceae bacterium]